MKTFQFPAVILPLFTSSFTCIILTGCGNDLSIPKATLKTTADVSMSQANTATNLQMTAQFPTEHHTNSTDTITETPPEKTSPWVTLAGMKCH